MKLTVPIYYKQEFKTKPAKTILVGLNFYRNAHYMLLNKIKHFYHNIVKEQLWTSEKKLDSYQVEYRIYLKNTLSDWPNVRSVIEKFVLDWLVEHWHLKDDSVKNLIWDNSIYLIDKENPRAEIIIHQL